MVTQSKCSYDKLLAHMSPPNNDIIINQHFVQLNSLITRIDPSDRPYNNICALNLYSVIVLYVLRNIITKIINVCSLNKPSIRTPLDLLGLKLMVRLDDYHIIILISYTAYPLFQCMDTI